MTLAVAPLLLASGCRWGPAAEDTTPAEETAAPAVPDEEQVNAAVNAIGQSNNTVRVIANHHPSLAKPLAALTSMHDAHLALLTQDGDEFATLTTTAKQSPAAALKDVRREELRLQRTLVHLAGEVSSGTLARTLASMAAGVAQHRQVLPDPKKGSDA